MPKSNRGFSAIMEAMKTDLSDEELKLIVEALEHYCAYTRPDSAKTAASALL